MKMLKYWCTLIIVGVASAPSFAQGFRPHPALEKPFISYNISGTLAIKDDRKKEAWVYDLERAKQRFSPASTFKIAHTLFALDAGAVKDEFQFFAWDGISRNNPLWDKHHTLKSAFKDSVVWVYQDFAKKLGPTKEQRYLNKLQYGNQTLGTSVEHFWLNGSLTISALEQIDLLQKLYKNALPFADSHQRLVKDLMLQEATDTWVLRGKTGWFNKGETAIGWYVGWVETLEGPVYFALNMNMQGQEDLPKRRQVVQETLAHLGLLPMPIGPMATPTPPAPILKLEPVETKALPIEEAQAASSSSSQKSVNP